MKKLLIILTVLLSIVACNKDKDVSPNGNKQIILTFLEAEPCHKQVTPEVLNLLEHHNIPGAFFTQGEIIKDFALSDRILKHSTIHNGTSDMTNWAAYRDESKEFIEGEINTKVGSINYTLMSRGLTDKIVRLPNINDPYGIETFEELLSEYNVIYPDVLGYTALGRKMDGNEILLQIESKIELNNPLIVELELNYLNLQTLSSLIGTLKAKGYTFTSFN